MEKQFWLKKWENPSPGFHQLSTHPFLEKHWKSFTKSKGKVFIPLCGKSLDIKFIMEQGHEVIGIDLSESAVLAFFEEHEIPYQVEENLRLKKIFGKGITLYVGDLFHLSASELEDVEYVYDSASLVALPFEIRNSYIKFMLRYLKEASIFLITFQFDNVEVGPPFSIDKKMVENYFTPHFRIDEIDTKKSDDMDNIELHRGLISYVQENVFNLKPA